MGKQRHVILQQFDVTNLEDVLLKIEDLILIQKDIQSNKVAFLNYGKIMETFKVLLVEC